MSTNVIKNFFFLVIFDTGCFYVYWTHTDIQAHKVYIEKTRQKVEEKIKFLSYRIILKHLVMKILQTVTS